MAGLDNTPTLSEDSIANKWLFSAGCLGNETQHFRCFGLGTKLIMVDKNRL